MKDIKIVLENGIEIEGKSFGFKNEVIGDFIFNTSLVGYQEVLSDPSYHQEIVVMTFPLQGIYGINEKDFESIGSSPLAFVTQEFEKSYSNNHATKSLNDYLVERKIVGITGIDTRYLTKIIRTSGSLKGAIVAISKNREETIKQIKQKVFFDQVKEVSPKEIKLAKGNKKHVVLVDFGAKKSIVENIESFGFKVSVVPFDISFEKIQSLKPDLVFLSNGPGDPADLTFSINQIKKLMEAKIPTCGICLGHQLISCALGAKTFRLKFGHHSINHPVQDLETNKVFITSQNHNYSVAENTLPKGVVVFMKSLHDKTVEGIYEKDKNVICVQFHPEAAPGPTDANIIFEKFFKFLLGENYAEKN